MKKNKIVILLLGMAVFYSCQDNVIEKSEYKISNKIDLSHLGTFPLSDSYNSAITKAANTAFDTDWENCSIITLASGKQVNLPWARITDANLPLNIARDIKKEDGWQLVFHTFAGSGNIESLKNYMMFYNQRTGFLKIFYNQEINEYPNNSGFWIFNLEYPQKMLNGTTAFTTPTNLSGNINSWRGSNPTNIPDNASFRPGWNAMQIMLTYDPNAPQDQVLSLLTLVSNISKQDLYGNYISYSKGVILTSGSSSEHSSISGDLATIFGNEAGKWIKERVVDSLKTKPTGASPTDDISTLAKWGLDKIFYNFNGSYSKSMSSNSDLDIQTKTSGTITGTIQFNTQTNIRSLRIPFDKSTFGIELGAWNLAGSPIIYINPIGTYKPSIYDVQLDELYYTFKASGKYDYRVIFNPELEKHLIKYWTNTEVIHYYYKDAIPENPVTNFDYGTLGKSGGYWIETDRSNLIYGEYEKPGSMYHAKIQKDVFFKGLLERYKPQNGQPYPKINILNNTDLVRGGYYFVGKDLLVKVSLYMITEFAGKRDTTLSTRTYAPKIEWDKPY